MNSLSDRDSHIGLTCEMEIRGPNTNSGLSRKIGHSHLLITVGFQETFCRIDNCFGNFGLILRDGIVRAWQLGIS
jgi:hypothetical protein